MCRFSWKARIEYYYYKYYFKKWNDTFRKLIKFLCTMIKL